MKIAINIFFLLIIFLVGTCYVFAGNSSGPPPPNPYGRSNAAALPPPPGLPLDDNIFIVIMAAVGLAFYMIHIHKIKIKPSI